MDDEMSCEEPDCNQHVGEGSIIIRGNGRGNKKEGDVSMHSVLFLCFSRSVQARGI